MPVPGNLKAAIFAAPGACTMQIFQSWAVLSVLDPGALDKFAIEVQPTVIKPAVD